MARLTSFLLRVDAKPGIQKSRRARGTMVTALECAASGLVPTRFRQLGDAWLLTNDFGRHVFLTAGELARLDRLQPDDPLRQRLRDGQFLVAELAANAAATRLAERTRFLRCGPNLHIFVVTLRCNHTCQYCHASRAPMDATDCDMDIATAERAVDFAFQSTSPALTLEFQGSEPLANWEVLEHIVEYALQKNSLARRSLMFALVSNLTLLDGPADLHDAVRQWRGGPSHDTTVAWIQRIHARYEELGLDARQYRVEALPTVTRPTLPRARELIDHDRAIRMRSIYLRPLDPFGWAATTKQKLGY
jgi:hypothetical protein